MYIVIAIIILASIVALINFVKKRKHNSSFVTHSEPSDKFKQKSKNEYITGFYGSFEFSDNKEYCVSHCHGGYLSGKWNGGDIALIQNDKLLFKIRLDKPNDCHVSNNGIVICCNVQNTELLSRDFIIFNNLGDKIYEMKSIDIGETSISENGEIAIFPARITEKEHSQIHILDIGKKNIINTVRRPIWFLTAKINTQDNRIEFCNNKDIKYETDFNGIQTNKDSYTQQVMNLGSVHDKIQLFQSNSIEEKANSNIFLSLLNEALTDQNASYSIGKSNIYRELGECYEVLGDIPNTLQNWEKALQIDPKVGIKRRYETLRRKENTN